MEINAVIVGPDNNEQNENPSLTVPSTSATNNSKNTETINLNSSINNNNKLSSSHLQQHEQNPRISEDSDEELDNLFSDFNIRRFSSQQQKH